MHILQVGVVTVVTYEVHRDIEVASCQRIEEQLGLELPVLRLDADLAPLVDREDAGGSVGLANVAVEEVDPEVADAGLLEQTFGLLTRLGDVAAVAGQGL